MTKNTFKKITLGLLIFGIVGLIAVGAPGNSYVNAETDADTETETTDTDSINGGKTREQREEELRIRYEEKMQKLQERKELMQEKRLEVQEKNDEIAQNRCRVIQERVDGAIDRYSNNEGRFRERFVKLIDKLDELVLRAETEGYDTTELKNDIAALKVKIEDASQMYKDYILELSDTKTIVCGQSDGDYKAALGQALEIHREIKNKLLEIRSFYKEEVKPELQRLRQQRGTIMKEINMNSGENDEAN